jgi:hypothetical protein
MLRCRARPLAVAALMLAAEDAHADALDDCIRASESGQSLRDRGRLREARAQMLVCASAACPAPIRADCAESTSRIDAETPTVVLGARDAQGRDRSDVRVTVDGIEVARALNGTPMALDPGERTIRFEAPWGRPRELKIVLRTGQKNRLVEAMLDSSTSRIEQPSARTANADTRWPGYLLLGVGVVGAATTGALWWIGTRKIGDMRDGCGVTATCDQGQVDEAKRQLVIGDVVGGVSLVALVAGAWVLIAGAGKPPSPPPGASIGWRGVAGGGVLGMSGRF